ncbi:MAG: TonB-dependent receptor [Aquabacterium sp.]|uniref:TonB-dependent receptor family protein n=1 Tax=Aquabacterium sp. TaxID=1872578 RepID=UPI00271574E0|nr:TonB-dependent receptor [Aquabacterium sp.]MDO9003513.1 TonB-dependent receptor [Aquabacterium sp.]
MTPTLYPTLMTLALGLALMTLAQNAAAQTLPDVVVTATRTAQPAFDIGASVDAVTGQTLRSAGPLVNLSEALNRVPGLSVLNRQNYAQDLQISSRGFGARSTFGVRGVRLYADGIPLTMPDGQGQASSIDLGSAQRIEVLRGPMSALYGNAAGGVIQVFTEDGPPTPEVTVGYAVSRDGFHRESVKLGGETGQLNYVINASHFETDGFRDHSGAQRDQVHAKLKWSLQDRSTVTVVGSYLNMPQVQDPLGLTKAQLDQNRTQAGANALTYNTRKDIANSQLGVVYDKALSFGEVRVMGYTGQRQVKQFQAIPDTAQGSPTNPGATASPGGVIDLDRSFSGVDARLTWRTQLNARPLSITGGLAFDQMDEHRRGYQNFTGTPGPTSVKGGEGALRRDEDNLARNHDQYLQAQWDLAEPWSISAGVRHSEVKFRSQDHYIALPSNPNDSGEMSFESTNPVASVMWKPLSGTHVYLSAGRSFETPTLNEVAYSKPPVTGWNTGLQASQAQHFELGLKQQWAAQGSLNVAVFKTDTNNEIGVDSNSGGRSTFKNVGRTERQGAEAALQWQLAQRWSMYSSLAWLRAQYRDSSSSIVAGRDLPGVPQQTAFAELQWRPADGWQTALEVRHSGRIWANDSNTESADGYTVWALRAGWTQAFGGWRLNTLARIDNLTDQHYVGSVIVNESNARYHEPSPGRSALLSVQVSKVF